MKYLFIVFIVGCGGSSYVTEAAFNEAMHYSNTCRYLGDAALSQALVCAAEGGESCSTALEYAQVYGDYCQPQEGGLTRSQKASFAASTNLESLRRALTHPRAAPVLDGRKRAVE